jgi:DNA mismatch repair protein MutS
VRPIRDIHTLKQRQSAIETFVDNQSFQLCQTLMRGLGDIERILSRMALRSARPRDFMHLRTVFSLLPELHRLLKSHDCLHLRQLDRSLGTFSELLNCLQNAIIDEPPVLIRDGGVIREGYDATLDELRNMHRNATGYLEALTERERERTGVSTLKVGFNKVHGYYIEISRSHHIEVPTEYVRRQTLKNAERYITPELKQFEEQVLSASEKALALEKQLYDGLFDVIEPHLAALTACSEALAELDVLANLAERADSLDYRAPSFSERRGIEIQAGRHPVVEAFHTTSFTANDLSLNALQSLSIITGPNMGGKSTYMRQTALIVLLAHIGSFVPASNTVIGPIDQIFTRIGASDDLAAGRSTFMVEMNETANILHNATENSLVLMDEIGRGTSTFDGLALAWSCAEKLAEIGAYTLFATHYFEMTQLPERFEQANNLHLDAIEHGEKIVFMHQVKPGAANQSYGIQVAQLAGLPAEVIQSAKAKLQQLEQSRVSADEVITPQPDLFIPPRDSEVEKRLAAIDPDELSPKAALSLLYELHQLASD